MVSSCYDEGPVMYAAVLSVVLAVTTVPGVEIPESPQIPYRPRSCVWYQSRYWASTAQSMQGNGDYRRQFDYPWSMRPTPIAARLAPPPQNASTGAMPVPNAEKPRASLPPAPSSRPVPPL